MCMQKMQKIQKNTEDQKPKIKKAEPALDLSTLPVLGQSFQKNNGPAIKGKILPPPLPPRLKCYVCNHCNKRFSTNGSLKIHMRVTREKNHINVTIAIKGFHKAVL